MKAKNKFAEKETNLDIKELIFNYLSYWKWFVLSVIFFVFIIKVYLRYHNTEYKISSTILIKDEKKGSAASEVSAFADIGIASGKSTVENQVAILKSRSLAQNVVRTLNLDISYYVEGRVLMTELYKENPIKITFLTKSKDFNEKDTTLIIKSVDYRSFLLADSNEKNEKLYLYNQKINSKLGQFVIESANNEFIKKFEKIYIKKTILEDEANSFNDKLIVVTRDKTSVVDLSLNDKNSKKAIDYINTLVVEFNKDGVKDKNEIANKTSEFIKNRLVYITQELGDVEKDVESYRKQNNITNIESDAYLETNIAADYDKSYIKTQTEIEVSKMMLDAVLKIKPNTVLPSNIFVATDVSSKLIEEYNELILERKKIAKTGTNANPIIQNIDAQLPLVKENIIESLQNKQKDLGINNRSVSKQKSVFDQKIKQIPTHLRIYNNIARQQKIKEELYLYLLQKGEETQIAIAVTAENAKIIDKAYLVGPVSMSKSIYYGIGIFFGLLIPFGIIFLKDFLDSKIKTRNDVEIATSVPFLGDVPNTETNLEIITATDRTPTAEAIRIVRSNLEFILSSLQNKKCKTIFVTSSVPKEGKTFMAINLAATFALASKKVLLIGLDIRNPKLSEYIDLPTTKGITNYLSTRDADVNDYIIKIPNFNDFHLLPSGIIPPNPSELLMNDKLNETFIYLKEHYDYIIVDTAPVNVVTDTFLISKNADAFIYVMRAYYLDKRMLKFIQTLYINKKLPNMALVLNDTKLKKDFGYGYVYGYGYGYGYGVDDEKGKSLLSRIKSFFEFWK